eukprot:RCo010806
MAAAHPQGAGSIITPLIPGKIYLADKGAATSLPLIKSHGITHAVNASNDTPNLFPGDLVYFNPNLGNPMTETLDLEGPVGFIESSLAQGGTVLVYCNVGVSRGPSIASAYLVKTTGVSASEALRQVQATRPGVQPIPNHLQHLQAYEARIRGGSQARPTGYPQQAYPATGYPQQAYPATGYAQPTAAPVASFPQAGVAYQQPYVVGYQPQAFTTGYASAGYAYPATTGYATSGFAPQGLTLSYAQPAQAYAYPTSGYRTFY